jgi:hypothetical protein
MSPIMMALLGLLAYKAFNGSGGQAATPGGTGRPASLPSGGTVNASDPGGERRRVVKRRGDAGPALAARSAHDRPLFFTRVSLR